MSNNLTVSEAQNIQSPPGNSLAVFLDKNGNLQLKDVRGNVYPVSDYLPSSGGGTPTLPDVFLGSLNDTLRLSSLLETVNLTVEKGTIPVLFVTGAPTKGSQSTGKRYLWKLGAGEFSPIGGTNIESKLELIQESFLSNDDIDIILSGENAEEVPLGIINEDFISYMNSNGPYVFTNVDKTYIVTFTKDSIDYAYIFQGTLGTYGAGNLQFVPDDFIFIYQSTNAGEPTNSTYIRITRAEAVVLQTTSSFVPGATYVITDADVNLYGGTEITLTAITPSELSLQGSGLFYCPKYDLTTPGYGIWTTYMEGTFSNILGTFFQGETVTANNGATAIYLAEGFLNYVSGDWSGATKIGGASGTCEVSRFVSPSYSVGQIVHWGGKSWTNVNGEIGSSIDKYTLDAEWQEIPFNATDYNVYIDEIQYDFGNDMIIYRKDRYNNVVSGSNQVFVEFESPDGYGYGYGNPIKDFQWGCAQDNFNTDDYLYIGIQGNQVIDSYFETLNTRAERIWFNELSHNSYIQNNILSSNSSIQNNTLSSNSSIQNNTLSSNSSIQNNTLSSNSNIIDNTLSSNSILISNVLNNSNIAETIINNFLSFSILNGSLFIFSNTNGIRYVNANGFNVLGVNIDLQSSNIIGNQYSKQLFNNSFSIPRLQYVNNSDVIVITDVDA